MSLGSAEPTAPTASPGTLFRRSLRTHFQPYLSLIAFSCCLSGSDAIWEGAWAGSPRTGLPQITQPGAAATAGNMQAAARSLPTTAVESSSDPLNVCERAGVAVEQASGLPPGLLLAIGRVESGRWDSGRGRVTAWPWAINAAGKGLWYTSRDDAARSVRDLLNGGTRSIDVGCFQINLLWHPTAFASLEQAFDPEANAAYAARFLLALFSQTGSWDGAVEAYHSSDPTLGFAYRQQVYSSWAAGAPVTADPAVRNRVTPILSVASRSITLPVVIAGVQIWTPMPFGTASGVVAVPVSGVTEQPRAAHGTTQPLPMVLYHSLPQGIRSARATQTPSRTAKVVSAEFSSSR
jgi:Transglycosylase SLT domain